MITTYRIPAERSESPPDLREVDEYIKRMRRRVRWIEYAADVAAYAFAMGSVKVIGDTILWLAGLT